MIARGRLTMADLAVLAGVSKITVSRALRDSHLVREELRETIKQVAREHGYRLNVAARDLRLMRRRTIAVVVDMSPSEGRSMFEPYPLALLGGIAQELAAKNYAMLVALNDRITESEAQDSIGVILLGQGPHGDSAQGYERWDVPMVVWGEPSGARRYAVVGSDNLQGGRLAGQYLTSRERKRLVFLGDRNHPELANRFVGFQEVIEAGGGAVVHSIACELTIEGGFAAISTVAEAGEQFDGIFACSDLVAVGAINALVAAGRRTPEDVSVVGYDDAPIASIFAPALTTIRQDWQSGGRLLAAKILELVDGGRPSSEALPTRLIVRGT